MLFDLNLQLYWTLSNVFRTVSRLVDEATKNAGQTEAIAAILTNLDPVNCQDQDPTGGQLPEYLDTGAKPTYLGNLVAKAILEKR